jgi:hypothetical protein
MGAYNMKKIFVASITLLLIGIAFTPFVNSLSIHKTKINITNEQKVFSLNTNDNGETDYWAVVVVIFKYKNPALNLALPENQQYKIYNALLEGNNWKPDHVKFLLNEDATRENILNALDWLAEKSDSNDIIFFYFNGHGTPVPDDNGDEDDGYDEVICPYDIDKDNGKLINFISDDELDEKLDKINAEGVALAFCSCFSGGLFDNKDTLNALSLKKQIQSFNRELTLDIEGNGRVIVTAAMEKGTAIFYKQMGDPFAFSLAAALQGKADTNKDKACSAEEIAKYVKSHTLLGHFLYTIGISSLAAIITVIMGGPTAIPMAILIVLLYPIIVELILYLQTGYPALPFPQIYDGYDGEMPLVEYS